MQIKVTFDNSFESLMDGKIQLQMCKGPNSVSTQFRIVSIDANSFQIICIKPFPPVSRTACVQINQIF